MEYFVKPDSIVKKIWSDTDCILFIFGACAGEFALHKSVDWLFFTGKLPNDPLGRLFSTIAYAQKIIFEEKSKAEQTLGMMKNIHINVEKSRGFSIPNWAYQDVLFMLIDYSIKTHELLRNKINENQKSEIYDVFKKVGEGMGVENLPCHYETYLKAREVHLSQNYQHSEFSKKLNDSYRKHLGNSRYFTMIQVQKSLLASQLIHFYYYSDFNWSLPLQKLYGILSKYQSISNLKLMFLPEIYRDNLRKNRFSFLNLSYTLIILLQSNYL